MPEPRPAVVHLVRHGHVHNPQKVVYGRLPRFPLSNDGRRQARATAGRLSRREAPLSRIYTSPLERAVQTAEILAEVTGAPVEVREALIETDFGPAWVGRPWSEIKARAAEWQAYLHQPHEVDFMGETFADAGERVAREVLAAASTHAGREVALVSHGDPIKAGVLVLTAGHVRDLHRRTVPTGGIVTLEVEGGAARIVSRWAPARPHVDGRPAGL